MPAPNVVETDRRSLQVHVDDADFLVACASRKSTPSELILTPSQLHRRNLKLRLARENKPRSSYLPSEPSKVARNLVADDRARPLDRMDRLQLLRSELEDDCGPLYRLFGTALSNHAEELEALREEVTLIAGRDDTRIDRLRDVATAVGGVAGEETIDLLDGVQQIQTLLEAEVDAPLSHAETLQAARDRLVETGGSCWEDAYGHIDRVHVAGVSTIGTPLLDFLGAIAGHTPASVHIYVRSNTGPRIRRRLADRLEASEQPLQTDVVTSTPSDESTLEQPTPATEIVAETPQQEARAALAIVDGICEQGVAESDIVVVARDSQAYERPLRRAARQYGRQLSVWTTVDLEQTIPYRLLISTCELCEVDSETTIPVSKLTAPVRLGWLPPESDGEWDVDDELLPAVQRTEKGEYTLAEWGRRLRACESLPTGAAQLAALPEQLREVPTEPSPDDVRELKRPLERFDNHVLSGAPLSAGRDLEETARTAHAVTRMKDIVERTAQKYSAWIERHNLDRSWGTVTDILSGIATTRPGRREHHNSQRVDVLDATDTYLRRWRYVIAVGLVDGVWPQPNDGALPVETRQAITAGSGPQDAIAVRGAWTDERDADFFADTVASPTSHLFVTRHEQDLDGIAYQPSPFLESLETTAVDRTQTRRLVAAEASPPDPIANVLTEVKTRE